MAFPMYDYSSTSKITIIQLRWTFVVFIRLHTDTISHLLFNTAKKLFSCTALVSSGVARGQGWGHGARGQGGGGHGVAAAKEF